MRNKLLFSIFVFFFISIFIALGSWQLVRLDWKNELLNKIDVSLKKEPVDLMTNVPEDYLKIKTSGVIDFDKQIYLYSLNEKGAPGFNVENVFCLPGVPIILQSMLGGLKYAIVGGNPTLSDTINLKTVESEIANSLTNVQDNNKDVEIGSYPFFQAGKLGVSIVIRSEDQLKIEKCSSEILEFVNQKKIEVVVR